MDSPGHGQQGKKSPIIPPLPRDSRGSLEVFNPSTFSSRTASPVFQSWKSWEDDPPPRVASPELQEQPSVFSSSSGRANNAVEITSWMALKDPTPPPQLSPSPAPLRSPMKDEVGAAAQRAAEWGLVLKTDDETGKLQGVKVRTSGEEANGRTEASKRDSGTSVRSSGDLYDEGTGNLVVLFYFLLPNSGTM